MINIGSIGLKVNTGQGFRLDKSKETADNQTSARHDESLVNSEDLRVDSTIQGYVQKVLESEEMDMQAIQTARDLVKSGKLDTPEAVDKLVDRLLDEGI